MTSLRGHQSHNAGSREIHLVTLVSLHLESLKQITDETEAPGCKDGGQKGEKQYLNNFGVYNLSVQRENVAGERITMHLCIRGSPTGDIANVEFSCFQHVFLHQAGW